MAGMSNEEPDSDNGVLGRSRVEAYWGILVGIAIAVIPYWWAQAALLGVAAAIASDLAFRAAIMRRRSWWLRRISAGLAVMLILGGGGFAVIRQHRDELAWLIPQSSASVLDGKLLFECEGAALPESFPERLYILEILLPSTSIGFTSMMPGAPPPKWSGGIGQAARCKFTNLSETAFLNAQIDMQVSLSSVIRKDGATLTSGEVVKTMDIKSPPLNIRTGAVGTAEFYFWNIGPYFVRITHSDHASVQAPGDNQTKRILLSLPPYPWPGGLYLTFDRGALEAINPQVAFPPSQAPPMLPEGR